MSLANLKPVDIEKRPQDATRDLRQNLDDLKNIEASQEQSFRFERGDLLEKAAGAAGAAAERGGHEGRKGQSSLFRELPETAGQQLVEQRSREDKLNFQGAGQEEQVQLIQQKAQLEKYIQATANKDREVALLNARAAFDYGMQAKQLIYAHDGALADFAFKVMGEDFERGRVTERELQRIVQASQKNLLEYELEAEKIQAQIRSAFEQGINESNIVNAKQLLEEYMAHQLKMQKEAARASNTASILSGIMGTAGAVIGGIYGGPAGAAVGSSIGDTVSNIFTRRR